jgi:DNA-binding LytR/AlgR family response regulator
MALFYALFIKFGLRDNQFLFELIKKTLQITALIILLPYSVMWLYFSYQDKKEQIDAMTNNFFKREQTIQPQGMIPFYDEKGVLRISIKTENLLYIEASDNYVNLYYINSKQKVARFLLRSNLKKIEPELKTQNIVRCHRSYMVNSHKVKVVRKEKDGLRIELDSPELSEIPVSKTYSENIMQILLKDNH